jgi:hypothetical protein
MLRNLGTLRTEYTSDVDDIVRDFYNPCPREATTYDRITGFFSSTVFHLTHPALGQFVTHNGGAIRLLCSPRLSNPDADGLLYGYEARDDADLVATLSSELAQLLTSAHADTARLLAVLVATRRLDVKLARVAASASMSSKRMFHDKVGLFADDAGDVVGFRGSANESYLGLAPEGNIESVDVWPSWEGGRDAERVRNAVVRLGRLWDGVVPGVTVIGLPAEIRRELERVAEDADLGGLAQRPCCRSPGPTRPGPARHRRGRVAPPPDLRRPRVAVPRSPWALVPRHRLRQDDHRPVLRLHGARARPRALDPRAVAALAGAMGGTGPRTPWRSFDGEFDRRAALTALGSNLVAEFELERVTSKHTRIQPRRTF